MALYEYHCPSCGARTEKRMPMNDVLQAVPCPCGQQARKVIGGFAVTGLASSSVGDGPAPWETPSGEGPVSWGSGDEPWTKGGADSVAALNDPAGGHGHSHGPGGHSHSH